MTDLQRSDLTAEAAAQGRPMGAEFGGRLEPDAAALALRDIAQRLRRTEERSEKAFSAVGDTLRRVMARLDDLERRPAGAPGPAPDESRLEALSARIEDLADALAVASGDIEAMRRRLDAQPPAAGAGAPPPEALRSMSAAMEQMRAEALRVGTAAERTAREALAQSGESARRMEEASAKLGHALAAVATRVDAFEKRLAHEGGRPQPAHAASVAPIAPPPAAPAAFVHGVEHPDDYAAADVAPYVARVERELETAGGSRGGSNLFDRIAAAAEARVNVGRSAPRAAPQLESSAPVQAAPAPQPYAPAPPSRREAPAAASLPPPVAPAPPVQSAPPPPPPPQPAPIQQQQAPSTAGALTVVPGRKTRSERSSAHEKGDFESTFGEEDSPAAGSGLGGVRDRLRSGGAESASEAPSRKGARAALKAAKPADEDDEDDDEASAKPAKKRGGLFGFLKRSKKEADPADDEDEDEEALELDQAAPAKGKAKVKPPARKPAKGHDEDEDDDEEDDEEDWEDEAAETRGSRRRMILLGALIVSVVAGFLIFKMSGQG